MIGELILDDESWTEGRGWRPQPMGLCLNRVRRRKLRVMQVWAPHRVGWTFASLD